MSSFSAEIPSFSAGSIEVRGFGDAKVGARSLGAGSRGGVVNAGSLGEVGLATRKREDLWKVSEDSDWSKGRRSGSSVGNSSVGVGHLSVISCRDFALAARKIVSRRSGTLWKPSVGAPRLKKPKKVQARKRQ